MREQRKGTCVVWMRAGKRERDGGRVLGKERKGNEKGRGNEKERERRRKGFGKVKEREREREEEREG